MKYLKKFNEDTNITVDIEDVLDIFQEVIDEFSITKYSSSDRRIPFSTDYPENSITYGSSMSPRKGFYGFHNHSHQKSSLNHFNEMRIKIILKGDKMDKADEIEKYINENLKDRYDSIGLEISTDQLAQGYHASVTTSGHDETVLISLVTLIKLK